MPTGASGIDCGVCKLRLLGVCSTCGPGKSVEAQEKIAAQIRILGGPCPVLACARESGVDFCLRDCGRFPCRHFDSGPYPYSEAYIKMQKRRRGRIPASRDPSGKDITVPSEYWIELKKRSIDLVCEKGMAGKFAPDAITLPFLGKEVLLDRTDRCLKVFKNGMWRKFEYPLLELLVLLYLLNVRRGPVSNEIVGVHELKDSRFFQGPHELKVQPVLERFGNDPEGFKAAAEFLGGEKIEMADIAYRLFPFPKIPLYYLLWLGDEEFEPRLSILFDRTVESCLSADAIWGLVNVVSDALLMAPVYVF